MARAPGEHSEPRPAHFGGPLAWLEACAFPILASLPDTFRRVVQRQQVGDETIETETLFDRRTGVRVAVRSRLFDRDGKTIYVAEAWLGPAGQIEKDVDDDFVDGVQVRRKTDYYGADGEFVRRIDDTYEGGRLRRSQESDRTQLVSETDYGYDTEGRTIRITERDGQGNTRRVTTRAFFADGSYRVTVTDYSTSPATVTTRDHGASGVPK